MINTKFLIIYLGNILVVFICIFSLVPFLVLTSEFLSCMHVNGMQIIYYSVLGLARDWFSCSCNNQDLNIYHICIQNIDIFLISFCSLRCVHS